MRLIRSHGGIYWHTAVCIILVGECSRLQGWNSSRGRLVKSRGGRKLRREGGRVACPRPLLWPCLLGPSPVRPGHLGRPWASLVHPLHPRTRIPLLQKGLETPRSCTSPCTWPSRPSGPPSALHRSLPAPSPHLLSPAASVFPVLWPPPCSRRSPPSSPRHPRRASSAPTASSSLASSS